MMGGLLLKIVWRYIENNPEKIQELLHALIDHWIMTLKAQQPPTQS